MFDKLQVFKGLIIFIIGSGALFLFYYYLVGRFLPFPINFILSLLGSLFMLLSTQEFVGAYRQYRDWRLMKKSLAARGVTAFRDGQRVMVSGRIFPVKESIVTPFTHKKCVLYTYRVYQEGREEYYDEGEGRVDLPAYAGLWLVPAYINSTVGKVRLLTFPLLEGFASETYRYSPATLPFYENASTYLQRTAFEDLSRAGILRKWEEVFGMIGKVVTNAGYVRKDIKTVTGTVGLNQCSLEELSVGEGEKVSLFGIWSSAGQGVVGDIQRSVAVLIKGPPDRAVRLARWRFLRKLLEGLLIFFVINLIVGIFWWVLVFGLKSQGIPVSGRVFSLASQPSRIGLWEPKPQNESRS